MPPRLLPFPNIFGAALAHLLPSCSLIGSAFPIYDAEPLNNLLILPSISHFAPTSFFLFSPVSGPPFYVFAYCFHKLDNGCSVVLDLQYSSRWYVLSGITVIVSIFAHYLRFEIHCLGSSITTLKKFHIWNKIMAFVIVFHHMSLKIQSETVFSRASPTSPAPVAGLRNSHCK